MRRPKPNLLILLVPLVVGGCSSLAERASPPDVGIATYPSTGSGGDSGAFAGTLEVRAGCLWFVNHDSPSENILPIFPGVVSLSPDRKKLSWVGGQIPVGTLTQLGGGMSRESIVDVPGQCATTTETMFLVVGQP